MSDNRSNKVRRYVERTKLRQKVLYHSAIFTIVNKILIAKNYRKLVFNNFLFKYYQLYRKIDNFFKYYQLYRKRDKNDLFSSHRALRNFLQFFQNFFNTVFSHGDKNKKMQY